MLCCCCALAKLHLLPWCAPTSSAPLWCCRSFIRQFEERPSGQAVDPEADSTRVQAFLAQSERAFRAHPVWRGCQPEVLDQAVEVSEAEVVVQLHPVVQP